MGGRRKKRWEGGRKEGRKGVKERRQGGRKEGERERKERQKEERGMEEGRKEVGLMIIERCPISQVKISIP